MSYAQDEKSSDAVGIFLAHALKPLATGEVRPIEVPERIPSRNPEME